MMKNGNKILLLLLVFSMVVLSSGCKYLGINTKDTQGGKQAQNTEEKASNEAAEQKAGSAGEQKSLTPQAGGPEPDPQSPFGKLTEDEQKKLVANLDLLQSSFTTMSQAFAQFKGNTEVSDALREGKSLIESAPYKTLKTSCQSELDKISNMDTQGLPESTNGITDSALAVSSWYQQFFNEFENQADAKEMGSWLSKKTEELSQVLQAFLDQLNNFKS